MKIHLTFRHADSSQVLERHIRERIDRLSKYLIKPTMAHIILNVEGSRHTAEITLSENHGLFNARKTSHDMYRSVDGALEKIEGQIRKYKEKIKDHHKKNSRKALSKGKFGIAFERTAL